MKKLGEWYAYTTAVASVRMGKLLDWGKEAAAREQELLVTATKMVPKSGFDIEPYKAIESVKMYLS